MAHLWQITCRTSILLIASCTVSMGMRLECKSLVPILVSAEVSMPWPGYIERHKQSATWSSWPGVGHLLWWQFYQCVEVAYRRNTVLNGRVGVSESDKCGRRFRAVLCHTVYICKHLSRICRSLPPSHILPCYLTLFPVLAAFATMPWLKVYIIQRASVRRLLLPTGYFPFSFLFFCLRCTCAQKHENVTWERGV